MSLRRRWRSSTRPFGSRLYSLASGIGRIPSGRCSIFGADGETNVFSPLALADEMEPELTNLGLLVEARFEGDRGQTIARLRRDRTMKDFDLGLSILRVIFVMDEDK